MALQGPYTLIAKLGEGGMAEVFKAVKTGPEGFKKPIALKRILPYFADHPAFLQMLSAEARLHAQLDHPNIVQLLDFFKQGGSYLIALEYVPGKNLRQVVKDSETRGHPISWQAALQIAAEILSGLDFAHKRKGPEGPLRIVHRDVSPQNILISYEGLVKLSDFGIARARIQREETDSGVVKGKQRYAAPEQLRAGDVDFRADLFSVGAVLEELVSKKNSPVPVREAIARALRENPSDRHKDAAAFRRALLSAQDPSWLAQGTEKLREWMSAVYPQTSDREEPSIQKTPVLSKGGSPLPALIDPSRSLIPGAADISRKGARKGLRLAWILSAVVLAGILYGWLKPRTAPPSRAPSEASLPEELRATAEKGSGTLQVEGPDGTDVFLNGRPVGRLPLEKLQIAPGSYVVLLRGSEGKSSMSRVILPQGESRTVRWGENLRQIKKR